MALMFTACGGGEPTSVAAPASFPELALETIDTASGQLHVEVRLSPQPPVRGQNAAQLTVVDGAGQAVDGLTLTVMPWMPSHGHGATVQPAITSTDAGVFVANPLYLFMAGQWELRIGLDGAVNDTATATIDIP
jgi:hypothetical protein